MKLNRAQSAREVGLPISTISNYMSNVESLPRVDIALKISQALRVPLDWLADDSKEYPPPEITDAKPLDTIDNESLMLEVAKRYRLHLLDLYRAVERAERADFNVIRRELETWKEGNPTPPETMKVIAAAMALNLEPNPWSLDGICAKYHHRLPGSEVPAEVLSLEGVRTKLRAIGLPADIKAWIARASQELVRQSQNDLVTAISRLHPDLVKPEG